MVTKRKKWPHAAAWARDDAAADLQTVIVMLTPLVEGERFDQTETLRRQSVSLAAAQRGLLALIAAGAKVRVL